MNLRVTNTTRGTIIAEQCEQARSFIARGRGLMGRPDLAQDTGLLIAPCSSIHTFFMNFPIDVVFINRAGRVVGLYPAMPPGRPYAGAWGARTVIELPAGVIAATSTQMGDLIEMSDA
ncbi:DUF192 domain-containing protein [Oscillochloris sp. ZM17-4]|uniref:DUF192 domain-containing protein n=1 Tax=Oscillochloris sp. ZM17-4 TaxID=2866714 RepID=UPI001C72D82D|nr:DUF192 domain-containing protein [Oscillochloris sp. ZM17-4]MBX0327608.1 DUF192 domain-containing protein [Oscillochloris sp. ZM17-4]